MPTFTKRTEIPAPAAELDRWHERPGAFERLVPPLRRVEILERTGGLDVGARVVLRVGRRPFAMRWSAVHTLREPGRRFVDVQESGPFARFVHEHLFEDSGEGRSALHDRVDYALPMGAFGQALGGRLARRELAALFCHRHRVTASDLARHAPYFGTAPLRVAVTGASGLVGSALCAFLTAGGHDVVQIGRAHV